LLDAALARAVGREEAEPLRSETGEAPEPKPAPAPEQIKHDEPDPLPIGSVVLPPLTPAPEPGPTRSETETLKASATSALNRSPEKATAPPRTINPDQRPDPAVSWREGLERLKRLARDRVGEPGSPSGVWTLRVRLLDWLDQAANESDSGALWRTVLGGLAELESSEDRTRAEAIRRVVRAIEDHAPLEITDLRLCRKVNGFGSFEPLDPSTCKPGQAVIIYCEMSGLRYEEAGEMFRSRLATQVEILSSKGGEPVARETLGTADDLCRNRRRDYYVCYRINLPETLAPGSYELQMTQDDRVAGHSTTLGIPFTVRP
jgi:hypothetical protein